MSGYKFKVTTTFPPIPSGIRNQIKKEFFPTTSEIKANKDPLPDSIGYRTSVGTSGSYFNDEQIHCNPFISDLLSDNRDTYFKKFFKTYTAWNHFVLFSGTKPTTGTSTRGLISDPDAAAENNDHRFKLKFSPDYNDLATGNRGKFDSQASYKGNSNVDSASFSKLEYKYSSDGIAKPSTQTTKKIDTETSSISGEVKRETYNSLDEITTLSSSKTEVNIRGSQVNRNFFDSDFTQTNNRGSLPRDDFKPQTPSNPSSSTTPSPTTSAPTTTAAPTSTTAAPTTTTSGPTPATTTTGFPALPPVTGGSLTTAPPPPCN